MADSSAQQKNLPASPRKLEKAREEGQVARSRDLGHFGAIAAGGALLVAIAAPVSGWLRDALARSLRFDHAQALGPDAIGQQMLGWTTTLLVFVVPFGVAMMAVALATGIATGGWTWTMKPLAPKLSAIDPLAGLGRVFSKQQVINALKASALALVLGAIGAAYLGSELDAFAGILSLPLPAAIEAVSTTLVSGVGFIVLALAAFAAVDVPLQRKLHAERLKMSHQELKQEHKELEGNAEIKGKVRARMREMTQRRMMAAVPKADLVVMNPTHYAVALKYDDARMAAPRVVAKGADLIALRIRDVAEESAVPVLEAPVLARALYAHAELDREIPAALFAAVAQVLAYVYQLRAAMAGRVAMPGALPALDVPTELDPHAAR
ncbi:MAG TPA: flagellar type III secretion system protein FlhB [Caldimonas sp.]|jgi:flagellar biosynthetic protein FlhB|nr:flagellar type III secretion system protein FlhB [Caldimonas sp.]HEX2541112.1 flagellar type III secretion system protein FlhB [Caldimonas sp.]